MNQSINAIIDAISVCLVLVVFTSNLHDDVRGDTKQKLLGALMICVTAVLILDIPAWLLDGIVFPGARTICTILNTIYYLAQIVYCCLWLLFVDNWISGSGQRNNTTRLLFSLPMAAEIILILINIKTGWLFTISADNVYARGIFYRWNLLPYYFYILSAVLCVIYRVYRSRHTDGCRQNTAILVYMLLPVCGAVLQSIYYGISWLWPFTAISLLIVYMHLQSQRLSDQRLLAATEATRTVQLQNDLTNSRVKIMLSQIQPHFLYNSLSVIQSLCRIDPAMAAKATEDFSAYLRCNMDSLSSDKPIPFERELQHTKRYLSLEKLRFEDALNIGFDIQATGFSLPALTLQPIVENAVRYGITKREDGGDLRITAREMETGYEIVIADNGVGFDTAVEKKDERAHIGITNVRRRLESMCGGTLIVKSESGVGTDAVIFIPKEQENNI